MEAVGPRTRLRRASEAASGGIRKSQKHSQASESDRGLDHGMSLSPNEPFIFLLKDQICAEMKCLSKGLEEVWKPELCFRTSG